LVTATNFNREKAHENSGWGVAVVYILGEKCPLLGEK
jgi:hypothetical protein